MRSKKDRREDIFSICIISLIILLMLIINVTGTL